MPSMPLPAADRCACGEVLEHTSFRDRNRHWVSEHCWSCGYEATLVVVTQDLSEPVTSAEVLAVHEALNSDNWGDLTK